MRRGVYFPYRQDPAHFVEDRGARAMYAHGRHRLGDPNRGGRVQNSGPMIGVARNLPALQRFDVHANVNSKHAMQNVSTSGPNSKWAQGRFYDIG